MPAGEALSMVQPGHPACVTVSNVTASSVTWTFNSTRAPWMDLEWRRGDLLTRNADGTVLVKHDHQNFVGTKDGKTWTINGTKARLRNPATKMATLTAEPDSPRPSTTAPRPPLHLHLRFDCGLVHGRPAQTLRNLGHDTRDWRHGQRFNRQATALIGTRPRAAAIQSQAH